MTYPPQPGGWPDQQGGWQQQPGGWQDPAGGYPNQAGGYPSPTSGQPAYVDPVSGQPTPYPDSTGYGQQQPYPESPGYAQQQPYPESPGYAGYPAYPGGYAAPVMVPAQRTNGMAIASMVVSLVGLVSLPCYGVGGIAIGLVGAILGHVGKRQTTERGEGGGGMALAGIIIGWIAVGIGLIIVAFFVFVVWWAVNSPPSTYVTPTY
jgi:hypothetical protein